MNLWWSRFRCLSAGVDPLGYLLVRLLRHEDVREKGSGNIGATNVARSGGKGLGIATLALTSVKRLLLC